MSLQYGTYELLLLGIFYWKEKEVCMSPMAFHTTEQIWSFTFRKFRGGGSCRLKFSAISTPIMPILHTIIQMNLNCIPAENGHKILSTTVQMHFPH